MKRRDSGSDSELQAFLSSRSVERRLPAEIRARVLARGRAIVASGGVSPPAPLREIHAPAPPSLPPPWVHAVVRIWPATLTVLAAGAVYGALSLHASLARVAPALEPQEMSPPESPVGNAAPRLPPAATEPATERATEPATERATARATEHSVRVRSTRPRGVAGDAARFNAGLALLQRAHAAYTRREFSSALALIDQHARRFPTGSLAEQRDALRVRALVESGRVDEAQRAAAAFAARFPRSVLMARITDGQSASE